MARSALFFLSGVTSGTTFTAYAHGLSALGTDEWTAGGTQVMTVASTSAHISAQASVSDGSDGVIVVWSDAADIKAQRYNASGVAQWTAGGVTICSETGNQTLAMMVADGSGGAVVTWQDARPGATTDIYAQRINASGVVQWTANGVAVCSATGNQNRPYICATSDGDFIIVWDDSRSARQIYAQKITAATGASQWTANGVALTTGSGTPFTPSACSDGAGGAIVAWLKTPEIYAQRINGSGVAQWTANGIQVSASTATLLTAYDVRVLSDTSGGAYISWGEGNGTLQLRLAHVDAAGTEWASPLGLGTGLKQGGNTRASMEPDGEGGVIVAWRMNLGSGLRRALIQKVNPMGVKAWPDGTDLGVGEGTFVEIKDPYAVSDGEGGAIGCFFRTEVSGSLRSNAYAQRIDASGVAAWASPTLIKASINVGTTGGTGSHIVQGQVNVSIPDPAAPDSRAGLENNIRLLIDDRNKDAYTISSVRMIQLMNGCMQTLGNRVQLGTEGLLTIELESDQYEYDIEGIVGDVRKVMLSGLGVELEYMEFSQMVALYGQGTANAAANGYPRFYTIYESAVQGSQETSYLLSMRVAPTPSLAASFDRLKVWHSLIPFRLASETATVPFSEPLLRAFERMVAAQCLALMPAEERQRRMISEDQIREWDRYVDEAVREENWRQRVASGATQPDIIWSEV